LQRNTIRLRGHHLLCLLGFRGLGYGDGFVENMARVHARLFSEDCEIEIVTGGDEICSACPKPASGECDSDRIGDKDSAILSLLSLQPGDRLPRAQVYTRVAATVSPDDLTSLCSKCRWLSLGYCAEGIGGLKVKGCLFL
jgi:hypothetical protein